MRISVHKHDNLRFLCDLDIAERDHERLRKPPPLQDHFKAIVTLDKDGTPSARIVNALQREPHRVEIDTEGGKLILFPAIGNGKPYIVTTTPEIALANATPGLTLLS